MRIKQSYFFLVSATHSFLLCSRFLSSFCSFLFPGVKSNVALVTEMERNEHTSNLPVRGKRFDIIVNANQVGPLKDWCKKLPDDFRKAVARKYGRILDLWDIRVDNSALAVLVQYWNPEYRCFEFRDLDLTPTLEEYACMMNKPIKEKDVFYFRSEGQVTEDGISAKFAKILNIPAD